MAGTTKEAQNIFERGTSFYQASPDAASAFKAMQKVICSDDGKGVLNYKTKELIAVAVAVTRMCQPCIITHLKACIQIGITREELVETMNIAVLLGGGPGYAYSAYALEWFEDLKKGE